MRYDLLKGSAVGVAISAFFATMFVVVFVGPCRLAILIPLLFGALAGCLFSIAELLQRREQGRKHVWFKDED
jgi:hypothetical protein